MSHSAARLLIVGLGFRGRAWAGLAKRHPRMNTVGVVDPSPEAVRTATELGLPAWQDLTEAVDAAGATAAVVCSPPDCHHHQARALLAAGIPVLVEKPVALSVADVTDLAEAAAGSGTPALAAHNFRFRPRECKILRELGNGRIGRLRSGTVSSVRPATAGAWSGYPAGRGTLWDYAVHHIDALCIRLHGPPSSVTADIRERPGTDPWTILTVRLVWENQDVEIHYRHVDGPAIYYHREWLEGTKGGLAVDEDRVVRVSLAHRPRRLLDRPRRSAERQLLDGLHDSSRGPAPSRMDIGTAVATIATLEAIDRALDSGAETPVLTTAGRPEGSG